MGDLMEKAKKRIQLCLLFVVAVAVVIGMIYYFGDVRSTDQMAEGTLIMQNMFGRLMGYGLR